MIENNLVTMEKFTALGELSGGVVHDIRNVLSIISGYIEVAAQKIGHHPEHAPVSDIFKKIRNTALDGAKMLKRV